MEWGEAGGCIHGGKGGREGKEKGMRGERPKKERMKETRERSTSAFYNRSINYTTVCVFLTC